MSDTETHTEQMPPVEVAAEDVAVGGMPAADAAPEPQPETSPAEQATPAKMHRFSSYLHVGEGAVECEHAEDGACEEQGHMHMWVRMPNQFERKAIGDKAAAAAARRLRVMHDEDSDARAILEGELLTLQMANERDPLLSEIIGAHFLDDHLKAVKEVEEDDPEKWATIDEDRERLRALEEMAEEDRPEEEFTELRKHLNEHTTAVNEARERIEEPRKAAFEQNSIEELVEIVREKRIENISNQARREEYAKWQWYTCTLAPKSPDKPGFPSERYFSSIDAFVKAPEEAVEAIAELTAQLEAEAQEQLKSSLSATHG